MVERRGLDEMRTVGAGRPASDDVVALYRLAFQDFGAQMLWSRRPSEHPTFAQALRVAETLRVEGNMRSRPLAARIEDACRAAL